MITKYITIYTRLQVHIDNSLHYICTAMIHQARPLSFYKGGSGIYNQPGISRMISKICYSLNIFSQKVGVCMNPRTPPVFVFTHHITTE